MTYLFRQSREKKCNKLVHLFMSLNGYNDGCLLCLFKYEFLFAGVCLWPSVAIATSWSSTPHLWLESQPSWEWYVNVSDQCTKYGFLTFTKYDKNKWLNAKLKKKRLNSPKKTIRDPSLTCDGKADPLESGIFCWMANQKNKKNVLRNF